MVKGAAEAGVGVDVVAVEVDGAVVEDVIEVGATVAVRHRIGAVGGCLPLRL
jgi:hypothetical protein